MEKIILATNNQGKVKEIQSILKDYKVISLKEANIDIEIEEDKDTFEENAIKKAKELCRITKKICLADDSGLCIEALNGFPGVKTARFLGENATQQDRNIYILEKMKDKQNRKAEVITCIAVAIPNQEVKVYRGVIKGYISKERRGKNGFGFDEIFEIEDGRTLAELDKEEKNKVSSRKKALEQIKL